MLHQKGPRFQLKQGCNLGRHAKDTQVLNQGKSQDLIELIAVITRGFIASGNVIPCRRWKLSHLPKDPLPAFGQMLRGHLGVMTIRNVGKMELNWLERFHNNPF